MIPFLILTFNNDYLCKSPFEKAHFLTLFHRSPRHGFFSKLSFYRCSTLFEFLMYENLSIRKRLLHPLCAHWRRNGFTQCPACHRCHPWKWQISKIVMFLPLFKWRKKWKKGRYGYPPYDPFFCETNLF